MYLSSSNGHGFTLIELLVVIAITIMIGLTFYANFGTFKRAEELKNSTADVQSLIKQAQANATATVSCHNANNSAVWYVKISDQTHLELWCQPLSSCAACSSQVNKDVNGDNIVSSSDLDSINSCRGKKTSDSVNGFACSAADLDKNGVVNSNDTSCWSGDVTASCFMPSANQTAEKTLTLSNNITLSLLQSPSWTSNLSYPFIISFSPLYGKLDFNDTNPTSNFSATIPLSVNITNSSDTKTITIDKGGGQNVTY